MKPSDKILAHYTLRAKDIPLIAFTLLAAEEQAFGTSDYAYKLQIDKVYTENAAVFPKNLLPDLTEAKLLKWVNRRKAPKNRQFVEKLLSAIDDSSNPLKYVDISHALSLNDAFWITNDITNHKWQDFNLYEHPFDEILSYVAFTGYSRKISGVVSSPEITSSGALKKCWSNRPNGIYLLKGDDFAPSTDGRSQATNEYYAAQVATALGLNHVPYDLEEFRHHGGGKEIICTCKLFTSEQVGFVDAAAYFQDCGIDIEESDLSSLALQKQMSDKIGSDFYADMMLFDSIIANRDRHLGNFGILVNNSTGVYLGPAPLFDNGYSFFYGAAAGDLKENLAAYTANLSCKYFSINRQAFLFVQKRHLPKLRKLLNFKFTKHPRYNIDDSTLNLMSAFVRERARKAIALYHEKEHSAESSVTHEQ